MCCSPRGHEESDMTGRLDNNNERWPECLEEEGVGMLHREGDI